MGILSLANGVVSGVVSRVFTHLRGLLFHEMIPFFATLRSFMVAIRRGLSDPQFRALASLVIVLLGAGTLFYWRFEDWTLIDSLYFSVITLTTVGYGDLAPTTTPTKVFTIVYVLIGLGVLVSFVSALAGQAVGARMERQERKRGGTTDSDPG